MLDIPIDNLDRKTSPTLSPTSSTTPSNTPSSHSFTPNNKTPPIVHVKALIQTRMVEIPTHILEQVLSRNVSNPLESVTPDDNFDSPLVINNRGYLLDDRTNILIPQTVMAGDGSITEIIFTVYTIENLSHFALYFNMLDNDINYANSDTYITYKNYNNITTTNVIDPQGYMNDNNTIITVTQHGEQIHKKNTVKITIEFDGEMGLTNMIAYMWNTDRQTLFVNLINGINVVMAEPLLDSEILSTNQEPKIHESELPADPEPKIHESELRADPEPTISNTWTSKHSEAYVLHVVRMWSGFASESITDAELLTLLELDNQNIPNWMMTELGVFVSNGDVTVKAFMTALTYVLEM